MYARIVTFRLAGPSDEEYRGLATEVAPAFTRWDGLHAKFWLADPSSGTYGGVYLFADREAAEASRETEVFGAMAANPAFADLTVREFEVLEDPTAITSAAVLPALTGQWLAEGVA